MRTCYLHLGMPKTGSTSIQSAFNGYKDTDLTYAQLRQPNHGFTIKCKFMKEPETLPDFRLNAVEKHEIAKRVKRKKMLLDAALKTRRSVIFSGESIAGHLKPDEIAEMVSFFKQRFERLLVIAYVRPLASLVNSQFQQQVKTGKREFSMPNPRYREFFQPIFDNIEQENLQLVRFDRANLIGGDIVHDFAERVGAKRTPQVVKEVNESLSAEAVGGNYSFNKYTGYLLPPRKRMKTLALLRDDLQGVGEMKFGLGRELIEGHMNDYAEDVAWIEDRAGFDVKGQIKTVPEPVESEEDLLRMAENLSAIIARKQRNQARAAGQSPTTVK